MATLFQIHLNNVKSVEQLSYGGQFVNEYFQLSDLCLIGPGFASAPRSKGAIGKSTLQDRQDSNEQNFEKKARRELV